MKELPHGGAASFRTVIKTMRAFAIMQLEEEKFNKYKRTTKKDENI